MTYKLSQSLNSMMTTLSYLSRLYISAHHSLVSNEGSDSLTPVRGEGMFDICCSLSSPVARNEVDELYL